MTSYLLYATSYLPSGVSYLLSQTLITYGAWPLIAVSIGLSLLSAGVTYYRIKKMQEEADDPREFEEGSIPVVKEDGPIPVVFGKVRLKAPNVVDYNTEQITYQGDRYTKVNLFMVWCQGPVNHVGGIQMGDLLYGEEVLGTDPVVSVRTRWGVGQGIVQVEALRDYKIIGPPGPLITTWSRDAPFFRVAIFMPGLPSQNPADFLVPSMMGWGSSSPHYRSVLSTAMTVWIPEEVFNLPAISMEVERFDKRSFDAPWVGPATPQRIDTPNGDVGMNPAWIVWEVMTDPQWSEAYRIEEMDTISFQEAGQTLVEEGFGLSFVWDRRAPADEFLAEVMRHIDGVYYQEPTTGKMVLRLIRDDYDAEALPIFGPEEIVGQPKYSRPSPSELINEVIVEYSSREFDRMRTIKVDDIASQRVHGANSQKMSFPGIYDNVLAARVATRELRALSQPLRTVQFSVPSSLAVDLRHGDVIRFSWPEWGIEEMVLRVARIETTATGSYASIQAIEDAFAYGDTIFAPPADEERIPYDDLPRPAEQAAFELPLWLEYQMALSQYAGAKVEDFLGQEDGRPALVATTEQEAAIDWALFADEARQSSGLPFAIPVDLELAWGEWGYNMVSATCFLRHRVTGDLLPRPNALYLLYLPDVSDPISSRPQFAAAAFAGIDPVTGDWSAHVVFGFLDTGLPYRLDSEDLRCYVVGVLGGDMALRGALDIGWTGWRSSKGSSVELLALPRTTAGELPPDIADVDTLEVAGRPYRPYPPGNISAESRYDLGKGEEPGVLVQWSERYRGGEQTYQYDPGDISPPGGVHIDAVVDVWAASSGVPEVLIDTITVPMENKEVHYLAAAEISAYGRLSDQLIFDIGSDRDGVQSMYRNAYILDRSIYTFTPCGASGRLGPSQAQINAAYLGTPLEGAVTVVGSGEQVWEVPDTGRYLIQAAGASGGYAGSASSGGRGAIVTGVFLFEAGQELRIFIGQQGESSGGMASGGGGTLVGRYVISSLLSGLVAGGGGGHVVGSDGDRYSHADAAAIAEGKDAWSSRTAGAGEGRTTGRGGQGADSRVGGGGGTISNGEPSQGGGGYSFSNGGMGGEGPVVGGFGGGGAIYQTTAWTGAGGGGGYSGGGGSYSGSGRSSAGGGGGTKVTSAIGTPVIVTGDDGNVGDGWVQILYLGA